MHNEARIARQKPAPAKQPLTRPLPVSALARSLPVPVSAKLRLCADAAATPALGARLEAAGAAWQDPRHFTSIPDP